MKLLTWTTKHEYVYEDDASDGQYGFSNTMASLSVEERRAVLFLF